MITKNTNLMMIEKVHPHYACYLINLINLTSPSRSWIHFILIQNNFKMIVKRILIFKMHIHRWIVTNVFFLKRTRLSKLYLTNWVECRTDFIQKSFCTIWLPTKGLWRWNCNQILLKSSVYIPDKMKCRKELRKYK